ncbi:MAG: hypothetical protein M3Q71_10500 [Chloroflexota bacterium]|nr:hypothetical protein [Chloroflexota bacterium]
MSAQSQIGGWRESAPEKGEPTFLDHHRPCLLKIVLLARTLRDHAHG